MRKVIILAGISGAGKSYFTGKNYPVASVCSADYYFLNQDGEYIFDPSKLPAAHSQCLRKFVETVRAITNETVVVDNTNTTVAEIAPYAALALAYGYELTIIILHTPTSVGAARNQHGVPLKTIQQQNDRLKRLKASLPPWWNCEEHEYTP
jgi:predicted kinase